METTVGNILLNELLPPDLRDYNRVINKQTLGQLLKSIGEKYPERYGTLVKEIKDLGDKFAYDLGSSFSLEDFKPVDLSHIYKEHDDEFHKILQIGSDKKRHDALLDFNRKVESHIDSKVKEDLKNPTAFSKWVSSGARGKPGDLRQMLYSSGNMVNVNNEVFPYMAKRSLAQGLSPIDYFITAIGARKGVVDSFLGVRNPGAMAKELFNISNDNNISEHDCGTIKGLNFPVNSTEILDRYLAEPVSHWHKNDLVTGLTQSLMEKEGIHTVKVRSPETCQSQHGVCAMCFGLDENGKHPVIGDTVGIRSAQALTEPLTQLSLSSKHTGGTVQKKTAFDIAKQILHVPENFTGGAVLSQGTGKVTDIRKTPDGGKHIIIDNHQHYALPNQHTLVQIGDMVHRGDALTVGIPNPKQIVDMKGMAAGRSYLTDSLMDIYTSNGIKPHRKIVETLTRSVLNLGQVEDPGDHTDHEVGQIVKWNNSLPIQEKISGTLAPHEAIGYRFKTDHSGFHKDQMITEDIANKLHAKGVPHLDVYKNPARIKPIMLNTERSALHKDWLNNLAFRFVKGRFIENVSQLAGANVTDSESPIGPYVSGNISKSNKPGYF